MIYFDNAATTFPKPDCVYDAITFAMKNYSFNAGRGSYKVANETKNMIEKTRLVFSNLVHANNPNSVIFTTSATESLNMILRGLIKNGETVYVSPFEHNAIMRTLANIGANIEIIPFNKTTWSVDYKLLSDLFVLKKPKMICISQVSNVTGYMLPYSDIFKLSRKFGAINVLDSAQAIGVYDIDKTYVDFMVFAGHKSLYASFGVAGFVNYNDICLVDYKTGGTGSDSLNLNMPEEEPLRYEAGTQNSCAIYSLFASINFLKNAKFDIIERELTTYLINELRNLKNIKIFLPDNYISCGIVSFAVEGYSSDEIGTILSEDYNICVRTGFHCAPYAHDFIDSKKYQGTVRVSLSGFNTKDEIDSLIDALEEL